MYVLFTITLLIWISNYRYRVYSKPLIGEHIKRAEIAEFPFIVSLRHKSAITKINHICGGALITKQHVLTSEHCLRSDDRWTPTWDLQVKVGTNDLLSGTRYNVQSYVTFNQWAKKYAIQPASWNNDIAILKLQQEIKEPGVVHGKLTELSNAYFVGKTVKTAGWGDSLPEDGSLNYLLSETIIPGDKMDISRYLRTVSLRVLSSSDCFDNIERICKRPEGSLKVMICTNSTPFALLGQADSGGPLVYNGEIIGINDSTYPKLGDCNLSNNGDSDESYDEEEIETYHRGEQNLHVGIEHYREFIDNVLQECW